MTLINLDLSNIINDGKSYDSSLILKMLEKDNVLCFFKDTNKNGIGIRIIEDDVNKFYNIEFLENINLVDSTLFSICGKINFAEKNKITFYQVEV